MLTTTVDGLWVLQVLTGTEVIAPELGLRPHLPSGESRQVALAHPVTAELREQGVVDARGEVDAPVAEWLTVLCRRDVALFAQRQAPGAPAAAQTLVARYAGWSVAIERSAELIRIRGAGAAVTEDAADALLSAQIEYVCGPAAPAPLRPVTIERGALRAAATSPKTLRRFLVEERLDADQVLLLMSAVETRRTVQTSVVALQSGTTRAHIDDGAVTIIDTPDGRLVAEHVLSGGRTWMIVAPGTSSSIVSAVSRMMQRLPAQEEWHSHRKVF
ncbi:ESX secretion-associated protein EspG [Mycobacterium celatum]|uniref:ESX secretion-associated protein EspG n=1 Tax=Mycobacterium celatum TaxID=28045 RepID=A0A1X1RIT8_MYCCE|nr:ESX secretion-associated protein EspG [Mycobacterium celatum]ORV06998.1 secretion protein EspG [Mycobacterium celatum]PIB78190.1 ESX secretion-associated protein EspG [Mycobacterium celatum]